MIRIRWWSELRDGHLTNLQERSGHLTYSENDEGVGAVVVVVVAVVL